MSTRGMTLLLFGACLAGAWLGFELFYLAERRAVA